MVLDEKIENVKDTKEKISDLIDKIKHANTIKETKEVSAELRDYIKKLGALQEKEKIEKEEKIAELALKLADLYHSFTHYHTAKESPPDRLYEQANTSLKEAEKFYHLPTIKELSEATKAYITVLGREKGAENESKKS